MAPFRSIGGKTQEKKKEQREPPVSMWKETNQLRRSFCRIDTCLFVDTTENITQRQEGSLQPKHTAPERQRKAKQSISETKKAERGHKRAYEKKGEKDVVWEENLEKGEQVSSSFSYCSLLSPVGCRV